MTKEQAAAFAAMSSAMAASTDPASAAVLAAEMSALAASGKTHRNGVPSPLDILTPTTLAAYLEVPETVIVQEAQAGRLPGRCIAGEWRFLHHAITDWLRNTEPTPGKVRPQAGVGKDFGEDPEKVIAEIYAERNKRPFRG